MQFWLLTLITQLRKIISERWRSLAFRRCPLAPTLTRFICLRFLSSGYLKSKVYVRKPRTVDDLKASIREEIATVPKEMLVNVMQNFEERLRTCVRQEGRHLSDMIFRNWVINVSNQNCIYYRLFWCWHNFFILKINKVTIIWKTYVLFAPPCTTEISRVWVGLYYEHNFLLSQPLWLIQNSEGWITKIFWDTCNCS